MSNANVIIIHGAYGYPEENWFGWLKNELSHINIPCIVPAMPTPDNQSLSAWLNLFKNEYAHHINQNTILIGHSLGAAFLLRWLEYQKTSVDHTLLVGAFIGDLGIQKFDNINKTFFSSPFIWQNIKKSSRQFYCYHGNDDPYVPQHHFSLIAKNLNAKKIIISQGGHLNAAAGYTAFPLLLTHLKEMIN